MMCHEVPLKTEKTVKGKEEIHMLRCIAAELNNIGVSLYNKNDDATAIEIYNEAILAVSVIGPYGLKKSSNTQELIQQHLDKINYGTHKIAASLCRSSKKDFSAHKYPMNMKQTQVISDAFFLSQPTSTARSIDIEESFRMNSCRNESAVILYNLGLVYLKREEFDMARLLFEAALSTSSSDNDDCSPGSLLCTAIFNNLGHIFHCCGQNEDAMDALSEASRLGRDALPFYNRKYDRKIKYESTALKAAFGIDPGLRTRAHCYQATILFNIGRIFSVREEHDKAVFFFSASLPHMKKEHHYKAFKHNLGILATLYNIGLAYQEKSEYENAIHYYQQVLKFNSEHSVADGRLIVTVLNKVYLSGCLLGHYDDKMKSCQEMLHSMIEEGQCELNTKTSVTLNEIGLMLCDLNKNKDALEFFNESLRVETLALGTDHPTLVITMNYIGQTYQKVGMYTEAMLVYNSALSLVPDTVRIESASLACICAIMLCSIGTIQYQVGDNKLAKKSIDRCLQFCLEELGDDMSNAASSLFEIGVILLEDELLPYAMECFQECLKMRKELFGNDHGKVADTLHKIGIIHQGQGEYKDAIEVYNETLRIIDNVLREDHSDAIHVLCDIAQTYHADGLFDQALYTYNTILHRIEVRYDEMNPSGALITSAVRDIQNEFEVFSAHSEVGLEAKIFPNGIWKCFDNIPLAASAA
mmetsp:Transcript_3880/g.5678  ORF Transcript_3880/g.5678 Transcript_3880/m.5678 type:complete len:699 (-) Transcript_3880:56-2152(-)|eukprot:CAMPEP_0195527148 /NCGR_PEP_ID=MMETSP0794_2-20130614/28632_1 /TAXON_ID=515487 /ORGANISM="Stephanopyxis turris, Strain CCMP 815" /LENGTH=698 /DNA_ID=CAMNT_0040657997 /DNA_START=36 /DNA_END=2132 /DNA_ORIENTATION=+